ncbi:MAG: dihydroxyacetone kinase phosphoryl donor subunit DhaM, partial [Pseudonocardiales bacterium]|nr:dihydroxyacetone kinase phosphoryl donor subunit DhaM [Pseudonocardiales bacterium]
MTDGPVGLVAVSHSRALADAAVALAGEMAGDAPIEVAAGLDGGFGTDAAAIAAAVGAADRGAGVVVVMDLGSAVLSAELALELLDDPALAERVVLCPAPFVEGLVVAAVAAAGGADRAAVAAEAVGALAGKAEQLGGHAPAAPSPEPSSTAPAGARPGEASGVFVVDDPHGLHARPAARLVALARTLDAPVRLRNATTGSGWVPAASLSRVATLGALRGHRVEVAADGPGAADAVRALLALHPAAPTAPTAPSGPAAPSAPTAPPATTDPATPVRPDGAAPDPPGAPAAPPPPASVPEPAAPPSAAREPAAPQPMSPGVALGP